MSSDSSGAPGPKESKEHKDKGIKKFWKKLTNQTNGSQMEEEVMSILEAGQESGVLKEEGKKMINSIFALDDKLAYEIMTPRTDVFVIDIEDPPEEYVDDLMKLRYSRIPVCQGETDNIIGILNIKDYLIQAWEKGFESVDIASILRAPYFVPETKNIDALLFELQKMKQQIAILIDEYGGFSGIVTMEDIIEQVVGERYGKIHVPAYGKQVVRLKMSRFYLVVAIEPARYRHAYAPVKQAADPVLYRG